MQDSVMAMDPKSFERFYREYRAKLRRFFRLNAHDRHAEEDLVQMVYVQLLAADPAEPIRDPQNYLWRIAWRVLGREGQRARRLESTTDSVDAERWDRLMWIEDDTQTALALEGCESALLQLPETQQTVLLLQYRDKLSHAQIAARLGVTPHAVKKYLSQALDALRRRISQDTSGPGQGPSGATS